MYDDVFELQSAISMITKANRYQSAVKTLSRLRLELGKFFGDITPPGFGWLPWSDSLGGWILCQQGRVNQAHSYNQLEPCSN